MPLGAPAGIQGKCKLPFSMVRSRILWLLRKRFKELFSLVVCLPWLHPFHLSDMALPLFLSLPTLVPNHSHSFTPRPLLHKRRGRGGCTTTVILQIGLIHRPPARLPKVLTHTKQTALLYTQTILALHILQMQADTVTKNQQPSRPGFLRLR